jgi:FAD:protein FMN transferase
MKLSKSVLRKLLLRNRLLFIVKKKNLPKKADSFFYESKRRRILKRLLLNLLVFIFLSVSGCGFTAKKPAKVQFLGMGTFFSITVYDNSFDKNIFNICINRVRELENKGNLFSQDSEISNINKLAVKEWIAVSNDMAFIISTAIEAAVITDGAFDITIKPLIDFYKIKTDEEKKSIFPNKTLMGQVGYENILFNSKDRKVFLKNKAQIDLSGIIKGYAVDEIVKILKKYNVQKALVNGGGNIYCLGTNEEDKPWIIGLRDPEHNENIKDKVSLIDSAIATSAGYESNITVKDKKYSHIIDPRKGEMVLAEGAVSVVTDTAIWADIFSTAVFVDRSIAEKNISAKFYLY